MKRAIVFAHFDKNNIIQDYVLYYLKELKKISDTIIFVSDSNLQQTEISKVEQIVNKVISGHHGEYDFGSYKIGYQHLLAQKNLAEFNEFVFVNDSCIGPLLNLDIIFNKMSEKDCDFWGIGINKDNKIKHVQSFFLVFKSKIINSECFKKFILDIKKEITKDDVINKYEIGLSKMLKENKYKMDSYLDYELGNKITGELFFSKKLQPLIKTSAIRGLQNWCIVYIFNILASRYNCCYPFVILKEYLLNYPSKLSKSLQSIRRLYINIQFSRKKGHIGTWKFNWK